MKDFNSEYIKGYNDCLKEVHEILKNIDPGEDFNDEWYNMRTAINKIISKPSKISITIKLGEK